MGKKENDFLKKLLATFKVEAEEHVRAMSSGLIELEKAPGAEKQAEIIETIFREAHSLKGAARAVDLTEIEAVCQSLESVFAAMKRREIASSRELLDLLNQAVDGLGRLLAAAETERTAAEKRGLATLTRQLESIAKGGVIAPEAAAPQEKGAPVTTQPLVILSKAKNLHAGDETLRSAQGDKPSGQLQVPTAPGPETPPSTPSADRPAVEERPLLTETIRISAARLDSLLLQAEELVSAKLAAGQRAAELRQVGATLPAWGRKWAKLKPTVRALAQSVETTGGRNGRAKPDSQTASLLEFVEWNETLVESLEEGLTAAARAAERDHRALGGMVDNLLQDMKQALMMPFASLLEIFPRLARELARDRGKEVELVIRGAEIEVDRRILQEIKDPLVHLVRNCIDHGIEKPEERARKNKSPRGTVTIAIAHKNGSKVEVLVSDDGAGVDTAKVRAAAARLSLVSPEAAETMSEQEALALIFQSGLSTSPLITDLSGRGLGLAIVQEKVEKLGGAISLETQPDAGATFRLLLPLTMVTFRGLLVRVDDRRFVLPTTHVERVARVSQEDIQTVENRETVRLDGQAASLVRLGDALELPVRSDDFSRPSTATEAQPATNTRVATTNKVSLVVLGSAEKRIAFRVDEILGEQEVLVKRLGPQLARVRNIAGATVLGTGQVVPILNVPDLMKSAVKTAAAPARAPAAAGRAAAKQKSILIAEDSITARTLLKNILEAAGYHVKTAVDGVDAFTTLRTEAFDLVVSDVDMPRMNGLDLTAKIRGDKKLAELPVVLVTALESREDRERGIDVGANAYLVKSSFDQSNLLEAIRRLI